MAIVMLINAETVRDGLQYLNDIVGIFDDAHQFSPTELTKFNFLIINGSVVDVQLKLDQIKPIIKQANQWESDGEYHWLTEDDDGQNIIDSIMVFQLEGDRKWFRLDNNFKFPINIDSLTPEEKQILETIDINNPSVDAFIRKIIKDLQSLPGNRTEIRELRNTAP